jgi:hypothetical protein
MGEVSVQHALKSLSSDKAKDRADGLAGMNVSGLKLGSCETCCVAPSD